MGKLKISHELEQKILAIAWLVFNILSRWNIPI